MKTHLTPADNCPVCKGTACITRVEFVYDDPDVESCKCPTCNGTGFNPELVDVEALVEAATRFQAKHKAAIVVEWRNEHGLIGLRTQLPGGCMGFQEFIIQDAPDVGLAATSKTQETEG